MNSDFNKLKFKKLLIKKSLIFTKYYFKNIYKLNNKILISNYFILTHYIKLTLINNKKNFLKQFIFTRIFNDNKSFKLQLIKYIKIKQLFNKNFSYRNFSKRVNIFFFLKLKLKSFKFLPDSLPFVNSLKTSNLKTIKLDNLINNYGYIYLKSSGINTFVTLTNFQGNV